MLGAVLVDVVAQAVGFRVVEMLANGFFQAFRLAIVDFARDSQFPSHSGDAIVGFVVDAVGAQAHYAVGIVVEHISAFVTLLIHRFVVARNAVLKHSRTHKQPVLSIVVLSFEFGESGSGTLVYLAQIILIVGYHIMFPSGNHPDDFIPILVSYRATVVGDAPKRIFSHLRAEKI